jgi:hypothetical protein
LLDGEVPAAGGVNRQAAPFLRRRPDHRPHVLVDAADEQAVHGPALSSDGRPYEPDADFLDHAAREAQETVRQFDIPFDF